MVTEVKGHEPGHLNVRCSWLWPLVFLWFTNLTSQGRGLPTFACQPDSDCLYHSTFWSLGMFHFRSCWPSLWLQPLSIVPSVWTYAHTSPHTPLIKPTSYSIKNPGPYLDMFFGTFHAMLSISVVSYLPPPPPKSRYCVLLRKRFLLLCLMTECLW